MIKSEYRIGRVWGIPIKIHISLLILLAYLMLQALSEGDSPLGRLLSVVFTLILVSLLFGSIALHELGHSFVAIRKGCRVYEITLMFMGGAAKMDRMPSKPLDEFLMAIAGPAVSFFIGIICVPVSIQLLRLSSSPLTQSIGGILLTVGLLNIGLALFNLIPAFPMDGGRIFRAALSTRIPRLQATYIASRTGRAIAVIFFFVGIFGLNISFAGYRFFPPHNPFLIIIAFFVFSIAGREYRMAQIEELMKMRGRQYPGWFNKPVPPVYDNDNSVIISPPPYEEGPGVVSELQEEENRQRNPLLDFFKRH